MPGDAAEDIGLPVVVKPTDGNHGRGVFIDLMSREEVAKAYAIAIEEGSGVLVERSIQGIEHRLLIVGGKLVAANRSDLITVTGDGKSTVLELIDIQVNTDPRRGTTELHPLSIIRSTPPPAWNSNARSWTPTACRPPAAKC
jgi:cyanophycin synthetase